MEGATEHNILLHGPPEPVRIHQAVALSRALGIPWFSAGDLLRSEVAGGTELGEYVRPYLDRGNVAPGAAKIVIREKILLPEVQRSGYILNGYARNEIDPREFFMDDTPTHALHLSVHDDVAIDRLLARQRHDDYPEAINKRLAHHHRQIGSIRKYVVTCSSTPFLEINGMASPEEVTEAMLRLL